MKKALAVSNILSWVNLIVGSLITFCVLVMLISAPVLPLMIAAVLIGCIILHSYAALQLRKSILTKSALNNQTPVGIRLMGFMSLFFAMMEFLTAIFALQNKNEMIKQLQFPKEVPKDSANAIFLTAFIFSLIFSLCVILNVILNFRLFRRYMLMQNNNKNIQQ